MYIHSSPYEVNGSNIPGVPVRTGCCRHGETIEIVAEIIGRLCRCVCVCMGGGGGVFGQHNIAKNNRKHFITGKKADNIPPPLIYTSGIKGNMQEIY